jgi:predicted flap endonuclease-1-like 5' DNA nuclease
MLAGAAAGGALGTFNHRSLGVTDEQQAKLMAALKSGGAALGVMADDFEVDPVVAQMAGTGGDVSHYRVEADVAEAITVAAAAQAAASEVVDEAVETSEEVAEAVKSVTVDALDLDDDAAAAVGKIAAVTGLSAGDAAQLYNVGIVKASDFLEVAALPDGRAAISEATGLDQAAVLVGAKRLDLMRVKGVGVKYSALLLASGVDTVPELATRNPANLSAKMAEVDAKEGITEVVPTEEVTADWVGQAKELPRMLYY